MPTSARPIVILGPTAGGKSDLAVQLAQRLRGPVEPGATERSRGIILGADSMQVYRHLDAGTAKPPHRLRELVRHDLIDIVEPTQRFTVHDWLGLADQKIRDTLAAGGAPVVVGGTNLYLKSLLEGLFDGPGKDDALRATLADVPDAELHARLRTIDPPAADRIAPADRQRLTRALEVFHLTGTPISELQREWAEQPPQTYRHDPILLGLRWDVDTINPRINHRVKAMFFPEQVDPALAADVCINGESLPDEARRLHAENLLGSQAREALGYKQVLAALFPKAYPGLADHKIKTLDDAFERTKILTRRFAKQQRTWLKRFHDVRWIDMPCDDPVDTALAHIDQAQNAEA
ncbi:MAG: tRNA (adenosine(37)-N6)-dimethylallyltransferase MiaA [Planctomycetota bacterium]